MPEFYSHLERRNEKQFPFELNSRFEERFKEACFLEEENSRKDQEGFCHCL